MEIYIGNVPKGTRPVEIKKLIKNAVKENIFQRLFEKIDSIGQFENNMDVQIHKTNGGNGKTRYGHVVVGSDRLGRVTVDSLAEAEIRGNCLQVREFITRATHNDRRSPNWRDLPWDQKCRRKNERRRV